MGDATIPQPISYQEQLDCARRELRLRRQVYPRRIAAEKMTKGLADREIRTMEAIVETLERLARAEQLL